MLRKIRIALAVVFLVGITLLFVDFTGTATRWLGWMAKVQFLPSLLALNVGVVAALVVLTLLFGRVYCSVVCPLGVMQDIFGHLGSRRRKNRRRYAPARNVLRYSLLGLMVVAIAAGIGSLVALLAPYGAYGRIAQNLLLPIWVGCNNLLAKADAETFNNQEIWIRSWVIFGIAAATLVALAIVAWRSGRAYCNAICPVGTVLGFLSRYSLFRPVIDTGKCNGCGLCARNCKSSCIDSRNHRIDYSRCVTCMDCLSKCHQGAITYSRRRPKAPEECANPSRRLFLTGLVAVGATALAQARDRKVYNRLSDSTMPPRVRPVLPPGSQSLSHLSRHCTGCQLCVAACPNDILRPSSDLMNLMQPQMSYKRGFCRPDCTRCGEVCPTGAILPLDRGEKIRTRIGHAVVIGSNCLAISDGIRCGRCARRCPYDAIRMVPTDPDNPQSVKMPQVDEDRCIGCGACENVCPARPFKAIYVEGTNPQQRS